MKHLNPRYAVAMFTILFSFSLFSLKAQIITTIAGNGTQGYSGDGGAATSAMFSNKIDLKIDNNGNLIVNDIGNNVIRKVDKTTNGNVSGVGMVKE